MKAAIEKANTLIEALPYIKRFHRTIFVIKYGGSILQDNAVRESVLEDIAFLRYAGIRPVLVHGGGPHINERLKAIGHPVKFEDGIRVTDATTLDVVIDEMKLLNRQLVEEINIHGAIARGFVDDSSIITAAKKHSGKDLGFVGEPCGCDDDRLRETLATAIPVLAPMGIGSDGMKYNINADEIAFFLAAHVKAEKLVFFTKELGVMRDPADDRTLIHSIRAGEIEQLIDGRIVTAGMVPKIRAGVHALHNGVRKVHIVDARISHALLLEIFTDKGIGTEIIH